jgi:S-adenosylmethionine:tRNA ribosyltransferase-isomerase
MTSRQITSYAEFDDSGARMRQELLADRGDAGLLVTIGSRRMERVQVRDLPDYVPAGSLMVLNTSGTFNARVLDATLRDEQVPVHFAQMLDDGGHNWIIVAPAHCRVGDVITLPGGASLVVLEPHLVGGSQPRTRRWGSYWKARLRVDTCFDTYQANFCGPARIEGDTVDWSLAEMQNCFSIRPTSSRMNNGGRNLTLEVMAALLAGGVQFASLEHRTGIGADSNGMPLPEYTMLSPVDALRINNALAAGGLIIPVGTSVVRALDYWYDPDAKQVGWGAGWCSNIITPERPVFVNSWLSGLHELGSSHLAMASAVVGEDIMRAAMSFAVSEDMPFHEAGDTHFHLPA